MQSHMIKSQYKFKHITANTEEYRMPFPLQFNCSNSLDVSLDV